MADRPQRPVSPDTHKAIAESLDEDAEWADRHGYPGGARDLRDRAARYRRDTGQEQPGG